MAVSPHTKNYLYGKGELLFKATGSLGYEHLGNAPAFSLSLSEEKVEHYSSMRGTKQKDLQVITQQGATLAFTLEEFSVGNLLRAFKGRSAGQTAQEAGVLRNQAVTVTKGLYLPLGKERLYSTRLEHGKVTGGTFAAGASLQGGTSSASATIVFVGEGYLECVGVNGVFQAGETLTAASVSAPLINAHTVADVVLVDKASAPTTRYRLGVDYDLNAQAGLLRINETSQAAETVYVSADHAASTAHVVEALTTSMITGELLFVGQPDQGPRLTVRCWNTSLSASGEVGLIGDALATIPMTGEVLSDAARHPDSPFFQVRYLD